MNVENEITTERIGDLQNRLRGQLSEHRFLHTLGVAYLSASMAMCYGVSHRRALLAGLLHDCAKNLPDDFLLEQCRRLALPVSAAEERMPFLLHGTYGAYLAETQYGVTDPEILDAIRYHTTGRIGMSPLVQIVFVADYLETGRSQKTEPSLDTLRQLAFQNLDEATMLVLENTVRYLSSEGKEMDPATWEVYEYYRKLVNDNLRKGEKS